ncbi:hypothetical protein L1765_10180 [Microaerobacter geothermalis]|uniref:hypothetical protein n=1 Tax=Microaerobacter geothermalis TaxID=674972 RepID=UPI001F1AE63D|nr:hypothetical protein [Microaerobacter geothermalis]MCF6094330.1 hypothetical protein [Microaerobacter geothermalis]
MPKWLEIHASYRAYIRQLQTMIEEESILANKINPNSLLKRLRNQRIRTYINLCRESYIKLGMRIGEEPEAWWLERLSPIEKEIFLLRYQNRLNFKEIEEHTGFQRSEAKQYFERSIRKVLETMLDQSF